jgi:hypothetical protein
MGAAHDGGRLATEGARVAHVPSDRRAGSGTLGSPPDLLAPGHSAPEVAVSAPSAFPCPDDPPAVTNVRDGPLNLSPGHVAGIPSVPAPAVSRAQPRHGRHRRAPEKQASYREVFAIREFRGLWLAQVISYPGDQFAQVAVAILAYRRTGSPLLTALAYALTYLPPIAGGPLLSGLADLFPRRRVMIICDVIRAGLVAAIALPSMPFAGLCGLLCLPCCWGHRSPRRGPRCCRTSCRAWRSLACSPCRAWASWPAAPSPASSGRRPRWAWPGCWASAQPPSWRWAGRCAAVT